jgi:hypothetical protein
MVASATPTTIFALVTQAEAEAGVNRLAQSGFTPDEIVTGGILEPAGALEVGDVGRGETAEKMTEGRPLTGPDER